MLTEPSKFLRNEGSKQIKLNVLNGRLDFSKVSLEGCGTKSLKDLKTLNSGESWQGEI